MSEKHLIVVTDFITDDFAPEREILGPDCEVIGLGATHESELVGHVEQADALIVYHEIDITRSTIEHLERCKLIVRGGVGTSNVDGNATAERGILYANVPDYGSEEVADTAMAMMLSLARGVNGLNSRLRAEAGLWSYQQVAPLTRLRGSTFGVIGLGRIGTAAALRAKAFGMDVVFYDPYKPDGADKAIGVRRAETLDELLAQSMAVSIHCPLTPETHHMIDAAAIAKMLPRSFLVNTARGPIIDTSVLSAAVESGQLAGIGLDVIENEPPSEDDPLITRWRNPDDLLHHHMIITPHAAFYSEEGRADIRVKTAIACRNAINGLPVRNLIVDWP